MIEDLFEDPEGTREEILAATYRALSEHTYADLTIKAIGEEFEKSPSLVYHHYDSKDDLVLALLEYMLEEFQTTELGDEVLAPREALETALEEVLTPAPDEQSRAFMRVLVELRSQVCHDPAFRDHFARSDRLLRERLAEIFATGVESGEFRDVDPEAFAETLLTLFQGVFYRRATAQDDGWPPVVRRQVQQLLAESLYEEIDPDVGVDG